MTIGVELNSIMNASSLNELCFSGEIKEKSKDYLFDIFSVIWERLSDLFTTRSIRQSLENRVVDLLHSEYKGSDAAAKVKITQKVQLFAIEKHFNLICEVTQSVESSFEKTSEKASLAWIRRDIKDAGGATGGTYYMFDLTGKAIGVFKSSETYRPLITKVAQGVKRIFGQKSYLNTEPMTESKAEVASHALDRMLQGNLTVQSAVKNFNGTKGCFQAYVEGMSSEETKKQWLKKEAYQSEELVIFQKFAFFDYALGNLDRHEENWFIKVDQEGRLTDIKAIDNANTFPKRAHNSQSFVSPPYNQYAWARESVAGSVIEPDVKKWIQEQFCEIRRQEIVKALKTNSDLEGFLTKEMEFQLLNRLAVLFELSKKEDFRPKDLLLYRYEETIAEVVKNIS